MVILCVYSIRAISRILDLIYLLIYKSHLLAKFNAVLLTLNRAPTLLLSVYFVVSVSL